MRGRGAAPLQVACPGRLSRLPAQRLGASCLCRYDGLSVRSYGYGDSPWLRLLLALQRSFRIGEAFGVEVRMYWVAAILLPLVFLQWTAPFVGHFGTALLLVAIQFVGLYTVIWSHEMGHIAVGWRYGIRTRLITLSPLGGVAHLQAPAPTPQAEIAITLAGPAVHLLWLAVVWPLGLLRPAEASLLHPWWFLLWFLQTTNVALLLFNLLPVFPLDGGRCLRALLALRWHPGRATLWATAIGIVGGVLLCLYALTSERISSTIGLLLGLSCISACLQERQMLRHLPVYGGFGLAEPWAQDPEAWRRGAVAIERPPGPLARFLQRRRLQKAAREQQAAAQFEQQLDRVLERVHEVGMAALSAEEKEILRRAAQRRRGAG